MKQQLFSLAICMLLFVGLFSFSSNIVKSIGGDGIVEVDVPVRGTFLRAIDTYPYFGYGDYEYNADLDMGVMVHTDYRVEEPAIVDLQTEGFGEGDKIIISYQAKIYYCGTNNLNDPGSTYWGLLENDDIFWGGLLGIFSTTSTLLDIDQVDRVPGAVNSGVDPFETPQTNWQEAIVSISNKLKSKGVSWYEGPMTTDIPNDFLIAPYTGFEMTIPRNARFLFLCCIDGLYQDNVGEIKVTLELDSDGDGLPDSWEQNGLDVDKDGEIDLNLPMLGADWEHKDIFVEIDYMGGVAGCAGHRPDPSAIEDVKEAFANAPVKNPDGLWGINLHVTIDEEVDHQEVLPMWEGFDALKMMGTSDEQSDSMIIEAKKRVFHYCIYIHEFSSEGYVRDSSGKAEKPGNDFVVADFHVHNRAQESAAFMHELGHNLGLAHGGGDETNYKPNYVSVMNYLFMFTGDPVPNRPLDYSRRKLPTLEEDHLDEILGIQAPQGTMTAYSLPDTTPKVVWGDTAIDWNGDGNYSMNVQANINNFPQWNDGQESPLNQTLEGYFDWENLVYRFRGTPDYADGTHPHETEEVLTEEIRQLMAEATLSTPDYVPVNRNSEIVVKEGDWIEYSAWYTGTPPDTLSSRFKVRMDEIAGTQITVSAEGQNLNGKDWLISETYDLETGFHDLLLIPSGLNAGDQFYHEEFGSIVIQGVEKNRYAGEERMVVWSTFSGNTVHWDQDTGVLCQANWNYSSDYETSWTLEKTNLWGQTEIDPFLIVGLGIVIAVLLLIVLLFFRKKGRKKNK